MSANSPSSKILVPAHYYCRLFLERHEQELWSLRSQFSSTSVMDERTELVVSFLESLMGRLAADPMLAATNEEQREEARVAVERAVFSQVSFELIIIVAGTLHYSVLDLH
jgi:hypothetical protein